METLLHISASPRGAESESLAIARTYLDTVALERPDVLIEHWDLWDGTLPTFGADAAAGKYAVFAGAEFTAEQGAAWARGPHDVRALRRRGCLPVQRPDVEPRDSLRAQAAHRRDQPARAGLRLRPGHRLPRLGDRQAGGRDLHQWRLFRRSRSAVRRRLPAVLLQRLAALGGHRRRRGHHIPTRPGRPGARSRGCPRCCPRRPPAGCSPPCDVRPER